MGFKEMWADRCARGSRGRGERVGRRGLKYFWLPRGHRLQLPAEEIGSLENLQETRVWMGARQDQTRNAGTDSPLNSGIPPSPVETVDRQTTGQRQTVSEVTWAKQNS